MAESPFAGIAIPAAVPPPAAAPESPFAGVAIQGDRAKSPFAGVAVPTTPPYDFGPLQKQMQENLAHHDPAQVTGVFDAIDAGLQGSVTGLLVRGKAPTKVVSPEAGFGARAAASVGGLAGDVPAMIAGAVIGAPEGAGVGSAITGVAGSFALPAALRATLMDAYEKGSFGTFRDFWERAGGIMLDTGKAWVTGAATGAAGPAARAALPAAASPAVKAVTQTFAEVASMTAVGQLLEGRVPDARDFLDAAVLIGGLKGAGKVAAKLRGIYAKTGVPPAAVAADAQAHPTVAQDVASTITPVPDIYAEGSSSTVLAALQGAIHKQESGGAATAKTSVTGARGGMQIQPETFAQYAKPGESIDNPADNLAVGKRIVADLYQKAGGDPARVAVGYFSGAGNIAPEGSPTPWRKDLADPTGKTTSSYVNDVMNRLQGGREAPQGGGRQPPPPEQPLPPLQPPPQPPPSGPMTPEVARESILSKLSIGEKEQSLRTLDDLYTAMIDQLHPVSQAVHAMGGGADVPAGENAYVLQRLVAGVGGKADQMLNRGTFDFHTYADNGPGLKQVLDPVKGSLDDFRAYVASKRAVELEGRGIESGMSPLAAKTVTAADAGRFGAAQKALLDYQDRGLQYLKDSGMLSADAVAAMRQANKDYVPYFRVMDGVKPGGAGKGLTTWNPVKRIKGSERTVVDPIESIVKNTYLFTALAERNAVKRTFIDAANRSGHPEDFIEKIPAPPIPTTVSAEEMASFLREHGVENPPEDLLTVFRRMQAPLAADQMDVFVDGKREVYRVDPRVADAFSAADQETANVLIKMLALPARVLRAGATLSPDFITRNPVRDLFSALVNSKGLFSPIDTISGLLSVVKKDDAFQAWAKGGGANAAMVSLDRQYLQDNLEKLTAETGLMTRAWNVAKNPLDLLRAASEVMENATRLGEFKKVLGGATGKAAIQEAAYASREVTLDFARMGSKMRALNMIAAFFNAGVQGIDRTVREAIDHPIGFSTKVGAFITLPSVLLWFANQGDDRLKEIPQWEKDLFWLVPTKDHIFRVPKPFEVGVVFGSLPERMLDAWAAHNPNAFNHLADSIVSAFTPNLTPTAAIPMIEQFANRSTFTNRPLVPQSLEGQLPEYQYTEYTTETAKALGRIFGTFAGLDKVAIDSGNPFSGVARALSTPALLENYLRAWTGGLGTYALQISDSALRSAGVLPDPPQPAKTLADIPAVKAFVVRYPSASAQSIQDFYDRYTANKTFVDTWQARAKEGDVVSMQQIQAAGGPLMFVQMENIKQALTQQSQIIRNISKNPQIGSEQQRQLIDGAYFRMIDLARAGNQMMRQAEAAVNAQRLIPNRPAQR